MNIYRISSYVAKYLNNVQYICFQLIVDLDKLLGTVLERYVTEHDF